MKAQAKKALASIEKYGALLVFPLDNRPEPRAIWHELHPRTAMRWEWDSGGDTRVADLWRLREALSKSGEVVYSKWYRGRATFFSKSCFSDLLRVQRSSKLELELVGESASLYEALCESSPISTKELKKVTELRGKSFETMFQKGMKRLFESGLIVGWGEVDDGAFPSLACGATKLMFEELWAECQEDQDVEAAYERLHQRLPEPMMRFLDQILSKKKGSRRT